MDWISVKVRLPILGQRVLSVVRGGEQVNVRYYEPRGFFESQSSEPNPLVTHWMPLPDPPSTDTPTDERR